MLDTKKIVLTGAPSTGKTSLINQLSRTDITCFEEMSRHVIAKGQQNGVKNPFLENPLAFSEALFGHRLEDYFAANKTHIHLYDRGIHDVVAYLQHIGAEVPCGMLEDCHSFKYDAVFILPPWEAIYTKDNERLESFEDAQKLHDALINTYTQFGMSCIEIPKGSLREREAFIYAHL
jgi:predicted ATPase